MHCLRLSGKTRGLPAAGVMANAQMAPSEAQPRAASAAREALGGVSDRTLTS